MKLGLQIVLLCIFSFGTPASWALDSKDLTPQEFEILYQDLSQKKSALYNELYGNGKLYVFERTQRSRLRLSRQQRKMANAYVAVNADWKKVEPIRQLRDDLVLKYEHWQNQSASAAVRLEATRIALHLFATTDELRKKFNMSPIPLWQNTLINLKIRERGLCYHWATDILESLKPIPREFFSVTWAESRPDTPHEHNVTVIFPKGDEFQNGLLFDPWRKGGKPYWRSPKTDSHFRWKKWDGYGIY